MYKQRRTLRCGGRPKAFWGAIIGAATSIAGSLLGNAAEKKKQKLANSKEDYNQSLQEAQSMSNALNQSMDYQNNYYDQYRVAARYGRRTLADSGHKIVITDGGDAKRIGNDTFLLRGGSHEDVNETGQTGIGINVGGNEIEAEGGEVAQKKGNSLRIFSAQPMLSGGLSPAQAIIRGYNKDKVFAAQQRFKKRNHLSDSGGKAKYGTIIPYKRIHINEDGTFTDTLTGKNYNTSATNGEDVVITGKANHWKEAGKKDTSSYFDPMGAVNFAIAAGAPILNANPSNIVGSIRDSKNASDFIKHYMMQNTGGFVNTKWAKKHPYLSLGINTIGDIGLGYGLGKTGVGLYRLRPSNLRKHIFENISPIGYDKSIPRIKEAFKSALSGTEADIDNPSWFNNKSAQNLNIYNTGITKNMFGPHALEARFDAWRKYLGLPQKFNTWTESPIVKGAYTDTKGISNLKVLPKDQSIDFINSAGGNVANNIEEFTTRGYNGQKYGVSHIRDTWNLQPWSRLGGNIIEDKVIRPLYNSTIGKANRKLSISLHKFINKYGYDNEAIQKYLNENGEEALDNLSDIIEYFADTKSIKGKLAHKLSGLDEVLNEKAYYTINKDSKLSKLTNKLSNKIKNFEASSLLPGAKPFKIAYDIPWTNEVFPNNEMIKGFNMINTLPTEAYRYKLKNPLLDYTYRLGGRCKLRNGGLTSKDRGSSKHPYPSVSSKDFAGGNRSYPIPTKADAVDALRLAGLHGRSDVRSKVYSKYPELRKKARGGTKVDPYYDWARNTSSNLGISFIDPTYDYRTYYNSATPYERNLIRFAPQGTHFTDIGKTPKHPTFSNESIYSNKKHPGGTWNGNVFVPSIWQFGNNGNKVRNKYMNNSGEGYFNGRINVFPRSKYGLGGVKIGSNIGINTNTNIPDYNSAYINWLISQLSSEKDEQQVANYNQEDIDNAVNAANLAYQNYLIRQLPSGKSNKQEDSKTTKHITTDGLKRNTQSVVDASRRSVDFASNTYRSKLISQLPSKQIKTTSQHKDRRSLKDKTQSIVDATRFAVNNAISYRNSKLISQLPSKQDNKVAKRRVKTTPQYKGNVTKGNYQLHDGETKIINGIKYTRSGNTIINHKNNVGYVYDNNGNYTGQADYSKVGKNFNDAFDAARAAGRTNFIYRAGKYNKYSTAKEEDKNKEALNRKVGARRVAKRLGGYTRPVERLRCGGSARPKAEYGAFYSLGYNNRYGSTVRSPYEYALSYSNTPNPSNYVVPTRSNNISNTSKIDSKTIPNGNVNSGNYRNTTFTTGDYIGLGIDTAAALATGIINYRGAGNYSLPERAGFIQAGKLKTNYNVNPQVAELERARDRMSQDVYRNTSSSVAALNRTNILNVNAAQDINKLLAEKENKETELINQDILNRQSVSEKNVANQMAYNNSVAEIKNAANQSRINALNTSLSGLSQAWTNFYTAGRSAFEDNQARIAAIAASEKGSLSRMLLSGYRLDDDTLSNLYRNEENADTKRLILNSMSPRARRRLGII